MQYTIMGVVKDGVVVPQVPLPEGTCVEMQLSTRQREFTPEERAEFEAWERASDQALELVERQALEMEANEKK